MGAVPIRFPKKATKKPVYNRVYFYYNLAF